MITYNYGNSHSPITLLQMVGDHDLPGIENEIREIHRLTDQEFAFVAVKVENWNHDLSPWNAPAVFGTEDFGDGAENTLEEVLQLCTDNDRKYCIGGYSMAGLFALWAAMQTDRFKGVAATSPSVWFPGFLKDMKSRRVGSDCIYLSLGDKEEKTRNPVMAQIDDNPRQILIVIPRIRNTKNETNNTALIIFPVPPYLFYSLHNNQQNTRLYEVPCRLLRSARKTRRSIPASSVRMFSFRSPAE